MADETFRPADAPELTEEEKNLEQFISLAEQKEYAWVRPMVLNKHNNLSDERRTYLALKWGMI